MKRMRLGDIEISATAICRGADHFVPAVTIIRLSHESGMETLSLHEWDQPAFECEREAMDFAWRRATIMAAKLSRPER